MEKTLIRHHNDNMNFKRGNEGMALCAQHYNLVIFLLEKYQQGPLGSDSLQWFRVMPCLLNIHQTGRPSATITLTSLKGFYLTRS